YVCAARARDGARSPDCTGSADDGARRSAGAGSLPRHRRNVSSVGGGDVSEALLSVRGLCAWYGRAQGLLDIGLDVVQGEVIALMGRNGAGKSTTFRAIMGLMAHSAGEVRFRERSLHGLQSFEIARLGLGYVPEDRRIFSDLSVMENLEVGRQQSRDG